MKKSRFTEPQILAILKQGESGVPVPDLCREHGISVCAVYAPLIFHLRGRLAVKQI